MDIMSYLMGQNSAIKKGMKVEVVTELPETGVSNVVYLVPKEDTGDNDIFDEYLWVDDDWEHIGSTDIDLSNYYTKSEVDAKLAPYYEITAAFNTENSGYPLNQTALQALSNIFTDAYAKNYDIIDILVKNGNTYQKSLLFTTRSYTYIIKEKYTGLYKLGSVLNANNGWLSPRTYGEVLAGYLEINIASWENNICVISSAKIISASEKFLDEARIVGTYLAKDNTKSYTPTSNYHPATKKYVDDSIASAITDALGGNY